MVMRSTRRGVLLAAGGAVGLAPVGSAVADQPDGADEGDWCDVEGLRTDAESARRDLAAIKEDLARQQVAIMNAHAERQPPSSFRQDVRERALETGLAARNRVVMLDILSADTDGGGTATGWFVEDGYVVTNAHNVDHDVGGVADEIRCHLPDGTTFEAAVVDYVRETPPVPDVAVLRTDYDGPGLRLGSSEGLATDQPLVQVGHPGGFGNWTVTLGALESIRDGAFSSSVPALEGSSGSPVMTLEGEVVGMLNASSSTSPVREGPPRVTDVPVQQRLLTQDVVSEHVAVEAVVEKLEAWT